jgi:hypothetical protein
VIGSGGGNTAKLTWCNVKTSTEPGVPGYLKGRSLQDVAADLRNGNLSTDQILIQVFEYDGCPFTG